MCLMSISSVLNPDISTDTNWYWCGGISMCFKSMSSVLNLGISTDTNWYWYPACPASALRVVLRVSRQ